MPKVNTNIATVSGNLTKDPTPVQIKADITLCNLRICSNDVEFDQNTNGYVDKPNYFSITVTGKRADACLKYLKRGSYITVTGKLSYSEWKDKKTGDQRSTVIIKAHTIEFLETVLPQEQPAPMVNPAPQYPQTEEVPPRKSPAVSSSPFIDLSESDLAGLQSTPPVIDRQQSLDDEIPF